MTTTARRFVIEDCDDHDRSRVVVCITDVHIVCLVESGMRDGLQKERKPPKLEAAAATAAPTPGTVPAGRVRSQEAESEPSMDVSPVAAW